MDASTATMNNSLSSTTLKPNLVRRVFMLFLFTAGVVLWLTVLHQAKLAFPFLLTQLFSVTILGLTAGIGARLALSGRHFSIQLIAALSALVLGLFGLGYLTQWNLGLGPLDSWLSDIDYVEAAQLGGSALIALLALIAWRRPRTRSSRNSARPRPAPRPAARPAAPTRQPTAVSRPATPSSRSRRSRLANFLNPGTWARKPDAKIRPKPGRHSRALRSRTATRTRPPVERLIVGRPAKPIKARARRRGIFRGKPEVQFSMYEEHKCPYCLDDVKRNDPRGVKECPVCHTLHHADCWSITGTCQVPHLNT